MRSKIRRWHRLGQLQKPLQVIQQLDELSRAPQQVNLHGDATNNSAQVAQVCICKCGLCFVNRKRVGWHRTQLDLDRLPWHVVQRLRARGHVKKVNVAQHLGFPHRGPNRSILVAPLKQQTESTQSRATVRATLWRSVPGALETMRKLFSYYHLLYLGASTIICPRKLNVSK